MPKPKGRLTLRQAEAYLKKEYGDKAETYNQIVDAYRNSLRFKGPRSLQTVTVDSKESNRNVIKVSVKELDRWHEARKKK